MFIEPLGTIHKVKMQATFCLPGNSKYLYLKSDSNSLPSFFFGLQDSSSLTSAFL